MRNKKHIMYSLNLCFCVSSSSVVAICKKMTTEEELTQKHKFSEYIICFLLHMIRSGCKYLLLNLSIAEVLVGLPRRAALFISS